ncbi:MAG: M23 family metallopeptidase [Leptospiraceae bacterium]|nr:M23 family metallopeptidase [Leptospiraceae bacterium]
MKFKKPRKLNHGKEILRTENFTMIHLGKGNLHYSYISGKKLIYGDIDLKRIHYKLIPLGAIFAFFWIYFSSSSSTEARKMIDPNLQRVSISEEERLDAIAKHADEKYLKETEEQKKQILQSNHTKITFKTYLAEDGETLKEIAERYKISASILATHSKLKEDVELKKGTKILIPEKPGIVYRLKSGDTLASVASTYKILVEDILRENNLSDEDIFPVGKKLFLPGALIPDPPPIWHKPVSSGVITSGFGWRTYPRYQFHEAWDLKANYEPVLAARSGRVAYSGWMGGYGNVVIIEHTNDLKTLYAHNSKVFVREGDYVNGGKIISRSGCTGYCFGAHLHFEIIKNGNSVNPKTFIKGFYPK